MFLCGRNIANIDIANIDNANIDFAVTIIDQYVGAALVEMYILYKMSADTFCAVSGHADAYSG